MKTLSQFSNFYNRDSQATISLSQTDARHAVFDADPRSWTMVIVPAVACDNSLFIVD